jgi:hypothetical protein
MRRRDVIGLLGGAPLLGRSARMDISRSRLLAISQCSFNESGQRLSASFQNGLRQAGHEERRTVMIEYPRPKANIPVWQVSLLI